MQPFLQNLYFLLKRVKIKLNGLVKLQKLDIKKVFCYPAYEYQYTATHTSVSSLNPTALQSYRFLSLP